MLAFLSLVPRIQKHYDSSLDTEKTERIRNYLKSVIPGIVCRTLQVFAGGIHIDRDWLYRLNIYVDRQGNVDFFCHGTTAP